jgi:hypothetical protein
MPDKQISTFLAFIYTVAAISGAAGGCLVAAHHVLRGRNITTMFVAAYSFVGLIFGAAGVIMTAAVGVELSFERVILLGLVFGMAGSSALAGANISARIIMSRLGIVIDVDVRRIDRDKSNAKTGKRETSE